MTVLRQIAQLGHPVLRQEARAINDPADAGVQALIDDMLATAIDASGVGIAAPQVYEPLALFIVASRANPRYPQAQEMPPTVVINPEIVWRSDEMEKGWEGCLSIPGLRGPVSRHKRIGVRYFNRRGEIREEEYSDFIARIFQHEFDHIKGVLFIDRVEDTRELATEKEYVRIVEGRIQEPEAGIQ
jgi:peptide deformylase